MTRVKLAHWQFLNNAMPGFLDARFLTCSWIMWSLSARMSSQNSSSHTGSKVFLQTYKRTFQRTFNIWDSITSAKLTDLCLVCLSLTGEHHVGIWLASHVTLLKMLCSVNWTLECNEIYIWTTLPVEAHPDVTRPETGLTTLSRR